MSTEKSARTDMGTGSDSGSRVQLRLDAVRARAELASTLDAIEYKLNLSRQLSTANRRVSTSLHELGEDNPAGLIGVALGAGAAVGAAVALCIRAFQRR
ncbi:MAG: hypothetical protein JWQ68_1317 [Cryobacterium sp.]|jgi:hypothetical protein|nr:hypothetical protein [Cryobacterium sp.]